MEKEAQKIFNFPLEPEERLDRFYCSLKNREILKNIEYFIAGKSAPVIYLYGEEGSGRSHLLQAMCHAVREKGGGAYYFPLERMVGQFAPQDLLRGLESGRLLCFDDMDRIAGHPDWEEALFHLFNRHSPNRGLWAVSARTPPAEAGITLPDLTSRLASGTAYHLTALSEREQRELFRRKAVENGFSVSPALENFIFHHSGRTTGQLLGVFHEINSRSLVEKRNLTIPYIKEIFGW